MHTQTAPFSNNKYELMWVCCFYVLHDMADLGADDWRLTLPRFAEGAFDKVADTWSLEVMSFLTGRLQAVVL